MTLSFSQKINGWETNFVRKIWEGFWCNTEFEASFLLQVEKLKSEFESISTENNSTDVVVPKLHTIREDKSDRWDNKKDIHMVINNRTPNRFQFAPIIPCVSTERFEVYWKDMENGKRKCQIYIGEVNKKSMKTIECIVWPNGDIKGNKNMGMLIGLSRNDGFDYVAQFLDYFKEDFVGKIIHWTNLRYSE